MWLDSSVHISLQASFFHKLASSLDKKKQKTFNLWKGAKTLESNNNLKNVDVTLLIFTEKCRILNQNICKFRISRLETLLRDNRRRDTFCLSCWVALTSSQSCWSCCEIHSPVSSPGWKEGRGFVWCRARWWLRRQTEHWEGGVRWPAVVLSSPTLWSVIAVRSRGISLMKSPGSYHQSPPVTCSMWCPAHYYCHYPAYLHGALKIFQYQTLSDCVTFRQQESFVIIIKLTQLHSVAFSKLAY